MKTCQSFHSAKISNLFFLQKFFIKWNNKFLSISCWKILLHQIESNLSWAETASYRFFYSENFRIRSAKKNVINCYQYRISWKKFWKFPRNATNWKFCLQKRKAQKHVFEHYIHFIIHYRKINKKRYTWEKFVPRKYWMLAKCKGKSAELSCYSFRTCKISRQHLMA